MTTRGTGNQQSPKLGEKRRWMRGHQINDSGGGMTDRGTEQERWIAFNCGVRRYRIFGRRRVFERCWRPGVFTASEEVRD